MKDDWLNLGFLGDPLKPYVEPVELIDEKRIGNYFVIVIIINVIYRAQIYPCSECATSSFACNTAYVINTFDAVQNVPLLLCTDFSQYLHLAFVVRCLTRSSSLSLLRWC